MGLLRLLTSLLCVVLLAATTPAWSQPLQVVSDPRGLFSIGLPPEWTVANSQMTDMVFSGLEKTDISRRIVSKLAAHSAVDDHSAPAILAVAAVDLPERISAAQFGQAFRAASPADWTVTQDGPATIAGRDAYYIYFTMHRTSLSLYMVMAYFTVGRMGFLVIGGTLNDPEPIRRHFAVISQILETFHPAASLGAAAP